MDPHNTENKARAQLCNSRLIVRETLVSFGQPNLPLRKLVPENLGTCTVLTSDQPFVCFITIQTNPIVRTFCHNTYDTVSGCNDFLGRKRQERGWKYKCLLGQFGAIDPSERGNNSDSVMQTY